MLSDLILRRVISDLRRCNWKTDYDSPVIKFKFKDSAKIVVRNPSGNARCELGSIKIDFNVASPARIGSVLLSVTELS